MAKDKKKRGVVGFTIFISLMVLIASLFLIENEAYKQNLSAEVSHARDNFHESDWKKIEDKSNERFRKINQDSGFITWMSAALLPEKGTEENFINAMLPHEINYRFVNNVQYTLYQASFRIQMLQFWFFTMLPIVVACVVTGYYLWRIKHFSMQSGNTMAIKVFFSGFAALIATMIAYILFPSLGLPGSYYLPALVILAMGYLVGRAIASFHLDF